MSMVERLRNLVQIDALVGHVFQSVTLDDDRTELRFLKADGSGFAMDHDQECCEVVRLEDYTGELGWLEGSEILEAREDTSRAEAEPAPKHAESFTWTFYTISTARGTVVLRWLGESNGYYSEAVTIRKLRRLT